MPEASRRRRQIGLLPVALLLTAGIAACTSHPAPPTGPAVEVARGGCGTGWTRPHGGDQTIAVHNVDIMTMEVELVDPADDGVYAMVEPLAPNSVRSMHVVLARGRYAFACFPEDTDSEVGPAFTVPDGPAAGGAVRIGEETVPVAGAVLAVSENDLAGAVRAYRAHVVTGLAALAGQTDRLRAALRTGDRKRSQAAWLGARMAYSGLGAAYGTFGDAADAIDGLPAGLPGGVHDKNFTGLRRVEYGLWHGEALSSVTRVADRLATDIAHLRTDFAEERTDPADLPLRAHEILENSLQFELTGDADQGAGAGLAVLSANLDGTTAVLDAIAPVLKPRYPGWSRATGELAALAKTVNAQHTAAGWTPPEALPRATAERLHGALGALLEDLAPIAAVGEVRRVP